MLAFQLFCLLCGAVFAFHYKVFILYPAIFIGWIVALAIGLATKSGAGSISLAMVVVAIALQAGYLFGIGARLSIAGVHIRRRRVRGSQVNVQRQAA